MSESMTGMIFRKLLCSGLVASLLLVSGCGFHLRGKDDIPEGMSRMFITGARSRELVAQFTEQLSYYGGQVTPSPQMAQVIMTVVDEDLERKELSISAEGKANEYELIYNLMYELKTVYGETILPLQEMEIRRDYYNPQINVVGKDEEERTLREEIYEEAVRAVMRRAHVVLKNNPVAIPEVPVAPPVQPAASPAPSAPDTAAPVPQQPVTTVPGIGDKENREAVPAIEMPAPVSAPSEADLQRRLEVLKRFRDQGLITEEIYQERVKKVLREGI